MQRSSTFISKPAPPTVPWKSSLPSATASLAPTLPGTLPEVWITLAITTRRLSASRPKVQANVSFDMYWATGLYKYHLRIKVQQKNLHFLLILLYPQACLYSKIIEYYRLQLIQTSQYPLMAHHHLLPLY